MKLSFNLFPSFKPFKNSNLTILFPFIIIEIQPYLKKQKKLNTTYIYTRGRKTTWNVKNVTMNGNTRATKK